MAKRQSVTKHSMAWWRGYSCQGPRSRNPYQGNPETATQSMDWLDGWQRRFWGEDP